MKPGDLVKLVLPHDARWAAGVVVSWQRDLGEVDERNFPTRFPEGTLAVFLSDDTGHVRHRRMPCARSRGDPSILIGGRVGVVWPDNLEAL